MNKKYHYDEKIFDTWTEDSAYLLGWLITDGCVQYVPNKRYGLRWELADLDAIETIAKLFKTDVPIHKRTKGDSTLYSLYIRGKKITQRVMDLGVTPRKTHNVKYPQVPHNMEKHFIRGVLDGDGSVTIHNRPRGKKQLVLKFSSASKDFLIGIGEALKRHVGAIPKIYEDSPGNYTLRYGARESFAILTFLYSDCTYYLQRKYDNFIEAEKINAGNGVTYCHRCEKKIVSLNGQRKWCEDCKRIVVKERERKRSARRRQSA